MFQVKKVFRLLLSTIIIAAVLSGCATPPPPLATSTGKPEAAINGASIETVFNAIADEMLLRNYFLKSRSETKNIALFTARGQYSGGGNIFMEVRVIYNLIDIPNGTRVMATILEYDYPGTNNEVLWRDHSRESYWAHGIQDVLNNVKTKLEKNPPAASQNISPNNPPAPTTATEEKRFLIDIVGMMIKGNTIVSVIADGPADKAGIKKGDLIVSIDGEPAGATEQNASRLQGKANTSVLLKIKRGTKDLVVPVIRENP
jgi:hypothetical protein